MVVPCGCILEEVCGFRPSEFDAVFVGFLQNAWVAFRNEFRRDEDVSVCVADVEKLEGEDLLQEGQVEVHASVVSCGEEPVVASVVFME